MAYLGNSLESQRITPAVDTFSGNGSATTFTLSRQVVSNIAVEAYVNNVAQDPNSAFSINTSNQIVFTSPPSAGVNNIYVRYNSYIGQYVGIGQGTVGTSQLGSISNINSIGSDLTLQINGSDVIDCKISGDVGIGGDPSTYGLNPRLLVRGPWATPAAAGAYGGVFVASTDALAADKGGTVSLGGVYDGAGNYTRYAAIAGYKNNATSGDYGGYMSLYTRPNGSAPVERMRISSAGHITNPYQPMCSVSSTGFTATGTGQKLTGFTSVNTNIGGYWSTANNQFTCPVSGYYYFSLYFLTVSGSNAGDHRLTRNGTYVTGGYSTNNVAGYIQAKSECIIPANAGDVLYAVSIGNTAIHPDAIHNQLVIKLVG